jgi:hypothetical protein
VEAARRESTERWSPLKRPALWPSAERSRLSLDDDQVSLVDAPVASPLPAVHGAGDIYTRPAMCARQASPPQFRLQFDRSEIPAIAGRYSYPMDDRIVNEIGPAVQRRGHYTRHEFIEVCSWKTKRSRSRVVRNTEEDVVEATRFALAAESERLRILIPMTLSGIQWATSSVLLHFGHKDRYPILDWRALEALGVTESVSYTLPFWNAYVVACRAIDDKTGFGMRIIDRAMWQWSKERSKKR